MNQKEVLEREIKKSSEMISRIREEVSKALVGQREIVDALISALICNGHVLIEGIPGIAKTFVIRIMAKVTGCDQRRIQFTVDLLPTDIVGITTYYPNKGFVTEKGPIFANFVIADEINRSPPKCVLKGTPILTERGEIFDIEKIINENSGEIVQNNNEFWIKPKKTVKLMSLDLNDYKIKPEEVDYFYKQKTNSPYNEVLLKTGRKIKVSNVHPFFTLKNGMVETVSAGEIKQGDCVLIPRKINLDGNDELKTDSFYEDNF